MEEKCIFILVSAFAGVHYVQSDAARVSEIELQASDRPECGMMDQQLVNARRGTQKNTLTNENLVFTFDGQSRNA